MKISIAADHGGVLLKNELMDHLQAQGIDILNHGTDDRKSVDFPDYAAKVAKDIQQERADYGILCCGTGIGMSIAANKFKGIRAAVVTDAFSAKATRAHNNTNILCLGERVTGTGLAKMIVDIWLGDHFEGKRHQKRLDQITEIEEKEWMKK